MIIKLKIKIYKNKNKKFKSTKISNLNLNKNISNPIILNGNLQERRKFLTEQLESVQKSLNYYSDKYTYKDNRFIVKKELEFADVWRYDLQKAEENLLTNLFPVHMDKINSIQEKIIELKKNLNEDIASTFINYSTLMKGLNGEEDVEKALSLYSNRYKMLKNIRIKVNGQSAESDMVIVCEKGVFVIETKNYGKKDQAIKISQDGKWYLSNGYNKGFRELKDVTDQNNYHCAINQTLINEELKKTGYNGDFIDCESIICIANNEVEINNESNQVVVRISNIVTEIKAFNNNIHLSEEVQNNICKILKENNLPEKDFEIDGRADRIADELKYITELITINNEINTIFEQYLNFVYGYTLPTRKL